MNAEKEPEQAYHSTIPAEPVTNTTQEGISRYFSVPPPQKPGTNLNLGPARIALQDSRFPVGRGIACAHFLPQNCTSRNPYLGITPLAPHSPY